MKTVMLTGSPTLLYQGPWRITLYMAAIIRRNRFVILAIFCFLLLMMVSWHMRKKVIYISYVNENSNDENEFLESNREYFSNVDEISNKMHVGQLPFINNIRNLPEDEKIDPFVALMTEKEQTLFQVEEFRHFIPPLQETDEFTTKIVRQLDEKFMLGDVNTYTKQALQYHEIEPSTSSKVGLVADTKYLYLEETLFAIPLGIKQVSLSAIQQPVESFRAPNQDNEWTKIDVNFSLSRNTTDEIDLLSINKHVTLNQRESSPIEDSTNKSTVLLIDTPGCKIPRLDPWDPTVKGLIELQDPLDCPGPPVFMKSIPGGSITINKTLLETYYNVTPEELICYYQPIYRLHEEEGSDRETNFTFGTLRKLEFGVPLNEDHVRTSCKIKGTYYKHFFPLVRLKEIVEERITIVPPSPKLNVILVGIDSVSKLNFLRHFPRTHAFLNEKLKPFEMNGYTKVGDNTFPNLVPLLTGRFVEYWWNETLMNTMFFDDIDFIWKEYAKRGYRTFYAEDNPYLGTFNYFKRGFYDPPTDYYFRPMALVLEMFKFLSKPEKEFCLNSQIDFDFIYDYLNVFTQTMGTRPYFGFTMVSTITHDNLNYAGWADEPTERMLEGLLNNGALNNTLLVLFSDHGLRFGKICETYVGKFEERLPLMYIHVPKWFLGQYPEIEKNMQINQDRLMTLFDIHATMIHLLDLNKTHNERSRVTLGRSLFEEITPDRTCLDAHIETHWCPCQTFDIVPLSNSEVLYASQAIVDDINSKLEPYGGICEILEVDTIMDARVGKASEIMLQYRRKENVVRNNTIYTADDVATINDYVITLVTKPGGAVFAGTVRHNPSGNGYNVLGLSRISLYGNTSWCIDSQKMKIFCYCKIQQFT